MYLRFYKYIYLILHFIDCMAMFLMKYKTHLKNAGIIFVFLLVYIALESEKYSPEKSIISHSETTNKGDKLVYMRESYQSSYNYSDNNGNNLWKYAGFRVLPDFSKVQVCTYLPDCRRIISNSEKPMKLIDYFPTANVLRKYPVGILPIFYKQMEDYGDQILMIGAGIQVPFDTLKSENALTSLKFSQKDISKIVLHRNSTSFLETMQRNNGFASFRGELTLRTAENYGFKNGISLGCPTLLINKSPEIGKILMKKYQDVSKRVGDKTLKVALNLNFRVENGYEYKTILKEYPNSIIYAQHNDEADFLYSQGVPFRQIRIYTDVEDWIESLRQMDVAMGTRIHGNMAALAAETPILVVAPDYRVLELVQRMKIPHITTLDDRLRQSFDIAELFSNLKFDGTAFDENRCKIANSYIDLFGKCGLSVSQQVFKIGSPCR